MHSSSFVAILKLSHILQKLPSQSLVLPQGAADSLLLNRKSTEEAVHIAVLVPCAGPIHCQLKPVTAAR